MPDHADPGCPMNVAFISPAYPPEQRDFSRGLAQVGARVVGIGDGPQGGLPPGVQQALSAYLQVPNLFDEQRAAERIAQALAPHGIDRVESNWEPTVLLAARVRELLGVPGMSRDTVLGFRDKETMKQRLRAAGVRVPHSRRVRTTEEALAAGEEVGYPLIIKPISGAGSADTFRCESQGELEAALRRTEHVAEASVEEFVDGDEYTFDTVCIDGQPVFESVAQYFPRPLTFRSEEWISPAQIVYRDLYDRPELRAGIAMGREVLRALGMGTGFTHMEWYRKRDGEVVFGEVACRNGGGHFVDMMNWSNDFDVYREWARAVCWKSFEATPLRRHHVAMVFKRAQGQGRIRHIAGMDEFRRRYGAHIVAEALLPVGAHRRDWLQTLLSDGWVAVRHPDEDATLEMMEALIGRVQLYAG
jgi:biotin carboxylase